MIHLIIAYFWAIAAPTIFLYFLIYLTTGWSYCRLSMTKEEKELSKVIKGLCAIHNDCWTEFKNGWTIKDTGFSFLRKDCWDDADFCLKVNDLEIAIKYTLDEKRIWRKVNSLKRDKAKREAIAEQLEIANTIQKAINDNRKELDKVDMLSVIKITDDIARR